MSSSLCCCYIGFGETFEFLFEELVRSLKNCYCLGLYFIKTRYSHNLTKTCTIEAYYNLKELLASCNRKKKGENIPKPNNCAITNRHKSLGIKLHVFFFKDPGSVPSS